MSAQENGKGKAKELDSSSDTSSNATEQTAQSEATDATPLSSFQPDVYSDRTNGFLGAHGSHHRSLSAVARETAFAQINQMQYQNNRNLLAESIDSVSDILRELKHVNKETPVFYATGIVGSSTSNDDARSVASSSSADGEHEPHLLPRQLSQRLSVFNIDLKMGTLGSSSNELLSALGKTSVASLFDEKIARSLRHLSSLQDRISDTAAKVLVTGDLNSGKSTFCNALLRRNVLPTDQQPLTAIFCEVREARENNNIEQVHAVLLNKTYNIHDESTYRIYKLRDLEQLVSEYDKYSILKVYVHDKRPEERSLLKNGVVDIALIDAPGLNMDSFQTTQVFARQDEIDLVIFVVSAENHFTQSSKEFISGTANEKSLVFIVVNRFDLIKDKGKCKRRILDQVSVLSPETHKDATDFVHFVSSDSLLPDGDGDDPDDDPDNDDNNDEEFNHPDFDRLEASLRNFVLEKRSLSKLKPAKNYLSNVLLDLEILSEINVQHSSVDRQENIKLLRELTPKFTKTVSESAKVIDTIDQEIEKTSDNAYQFTVQAVNDALNRHDALVPYTSTADLYSYAVATRAARIDHIQQAVNDAESHARLLTSKAVGHINKLGILHLGNQPAFEKVFRQDLMFTRKRDKLSRSIKAELSIMDCFDIQIPLPAINLSQYFPESWKIWESETESKAVAETQVSTLQNALTLASVVGTGQIIRTYSYWIQHGISIAFHLNMTTVKAIAIPVVAISAGAAIYYVVSDIPNALSRNIRRKIALEVEALGYTHSNAERIAKECRRVLKYPAGEVRAGFQTRVETEAKKKDEYTSNARAAEKTEKYFKEMHIRVAKERAKVEDCRLESVE